MISVHTAGYTIEMGLVENRNAGYMFIVEFQAPVMCVVMSEAYGYGNQVIIPPFLNINHSTTENTEFQTPMSRLSVPSLYLPPLPRPFPPLFV